MDDLNEKLSELLNDPDGMEKIRKMAQTLLGESEKPPEDSGNTLPNIDMASVAKVMSLLKSNRQDDKRIKLLYALKPNLSPEKQEKVDSAIKILKLIELAPLLGEAGLISL